MATSTHAPGIRRAGLLMAFLSLMSTAVYPQNTETLYFLEVGGRFADLEKKALQRLENPSQRTTSVVGPLCIAQSKLKKYRQLFECLNRLEARIREEDVTIRPDYPLAALSGNSADVSAMPHTLRAEALIDLGRYQEAISEAQAGLAAITDRYASGNWPPVRYKIMNFSILAHGSALTGKREAARTYLAKMNDLSIPFMNSGWWHGLRRHGNAKTLLALGEYAEAMKYLADIEGRSGLLGAVIGIANWGWGLSARGASTISFTEIPWLVMRGKALAELGKLAEAKEALDEAMASKRFAEFGDMAWLAYYERGRIAEKENKPLEAIEFFRKSIEIFEQQRSSLNSETSKIGFVGDKQEVYARLVSHLIAAGQTAQAFDYVERAKARALVDLLASKQDFSPQSLDPAAARAILAKLDEADLASRVQDAMAEVGSNVQTRNLMTARKELQAAAPELASLVTVSTTASSDLQSLIADGETLVEYFQAVNNWFAFVLNRDQLSVVALGEINLRDKVGALRRRIEEPNSNAWQGPARELYEGIWKPLEAKASIKNVIIVPHGPLHYLPFAALQKPDGTFLLDSIGLRLLPSASVLKFLKPASKREAQLLVFGNPDLGDPKLDLAFAEREARTIAALSPGSRVLVRHDASETNLKKAAPLFSRLHIASHGRFQAKDPLNSGLHLAKDAENDGILTVGELYSMNLDMDLVTLSACETGLGEIANGDDVVGLTRGFLYAGSRSIVASLWSVEDKATAELMQAFYENLGKLSKQEALRQAQIRTRQSFQHPFFWAAFQLTGRAE